MMYDFRDYVTGLDTLVPVDLGKRRYINLDNAASTPPFKSVIKALNDFAPWYSSVHRGNGLKSRLSTEVYEEARRIVGKFVGANSQDHVVIFGKNTTEAINKLSYRLNLHRKDIVLISHLEHHSNDLPWRAQATVKRIGSTSQGVIDRSDFEKLLERYKGEVKLVAITGASNVTGHMPDIHWFARKAHEAGALILIDCAQLAAHRPIYMHALHDPDHLDFIALSAHKMYAPFGTGALIGRRDVFSRGEPEYKGGGTVQLVTPKTVDWAASPDSDEAGSPNVAGAVALAVAIQTLETIGLDAIAENEAALTRYALGRLQEIRQLTLYGETANLASRSGVISFGLDGLSPHLVSAILGYEWGIGVRSGCFCAHPYVLSLLGIEGREQHSVRHSVLHHRRDLVPGMVRASFGLYNTKEDVDILVEALKTISCGYYGEYTVDCQSGSYAPKQAPEDFAPYFSIPGH